MKKKILTAITVALLSLSTITCMCAESPTASKVHNVTIGTTVGTTGSSTIKVDGGSVTTSTGVVEDGKEVTFTANPDPGYVFVEWIITGDYTIVSGTLTSTTITIIPKGDIKVDAKYAKIPEETTVVEQTTVAEEITTVEDLEEEETEEEETAAPDDSDKSPQTGLPVAGALATLIVAGGIAVSSKKRI